MGTAPIQATYPSDVTTFTLPELFGTKVRALYQRRKGRDLFDLWYALTGTDVEYSVPDAFALVVDRFSLAPKPE